MDFVEELNNLVYLVKKNSKKVTGIKLTQKDIADRMGINSTYLSNLLGGKQPVTEKHITDFKIKFRDELTGLTPERAMLNVLMEEMAIYMSGKDEKKKEQLINDWRQKVIQRLGD